MIEHYESNSNRVISLMLQANDLREKQDYLQAVDKYKDIIEKFGETSDLDHVIAYSYFELALYEHDEANFRMAINWIKKAINLSQNSSYLYDTLGEIKSIGTLEYKEAAESFRKAIELNPDNVHALVSGASLYGVPEEVVSLKEAIIWLEQAVRIEPYEPNYHLNLGMLYKETGQINKSESEILKSMVCPKPLNSSFTKTIWKLLGGIDTKFEA